MVYEQEPLSIVQTQIDMLTEEVNEYADEEIQIFYNFVKIKTANHLSKLKKENALDKSIYLEKNILQLIKSQDVGEAL